MTTSAGSGIARAGWVAAGLAALSLHLAGAALAFWTLHGDDPDPELGAPAIEIGVELLAPRGETSEQAPGPDAEASAPAPNSAAQAAATTPVDLPKADPVETADPDRQAAPDPPPTPPKEAEPLASAPSNPSTPSLASEATAVPESPTLPPATRSVAPAVGVGEAFERVRATWQKELLAHLNRFKRYPDEETEASAEILVDLVLDESGRVASAKVLRSSGRDAFDRAALAMIHRADPVPKPPAAVAQAGLEFALPVVFRAGRGRP